MPLKAFPYFGSSFNLLDTILGLIPDHYHYCEPYGGSATVLLNKPESPIETYNDLDSEVVTFFRVLRSNVNGLLEQLELTPNSREEYDLSQIPDTGLTDLERARLFYVRMRQGYMSSPRVGANKGWRFEYKARKDVAYQRYWQNSVESLRAVAARLRAAQIEHLPALELIRRADSPDAFFFIDPDYIPETIEFQQYYNLRMTPADHRALAAALNQIEGKALVSGYRSELYDEIFADWRRIDIPVQLRSSKRERVESLWLNYEPPARQLALTLGDVRKLEPEELRL